MPAAKAVAVATHAWTKLYTEIMSRVSGQCVYECCYAWPLPEVDLNHHHDRNLYCQWAAYRWWSIAAQTRSCHACFNFSCLHSKSLTLHSGNSPPSTECTSSTFIKYFNVMRSFEIYAIWPQASIYLYTHTHAQCSLSSVRLGQAHPIYRNVAEVRSRSWKLAACSNC